MTTKEEIDIKYGKKVRNTFIGWLLMVVSFMGADAYYGTYKTLNEADNLPGRPIYQEHFAAKQTLSELTYKIKNKDKLLSKIELEKKGFPGGSFVPSIGYVPLKADILKLDSIFAEEIQKKKTLDSLVCLIEKRVKEIEEDTNYQKYSEIVDNAIYGPLIRLLGVLGITGIGFYLLGRKYEKAKKEEYRFAGIKEHPNQNLGG